MKTCLYLYGVKEATWKDLSYIEALNIKISMAKNLLIELNKVHYMESDDVRIKDIALAIEFNEGLLNE